MPSHLPLYAVVGVITLILSGCIPGRAVVDTRSSLDDIEALAATLPAGSAPTVAQYQFARQSFVGSMTDLMAQQARQARSPVGKVKTAIAAAGVVLGLGGTAASLVVNNEDTRAAIAQASGAVASVTGIIGLLPFGSGADDAQAVETYLAAEMPVFEERWPETLDQPLTPLEWAGFVQDAEHVSRLVEELSR